jgi:hypothetical protein
LENSCFSKESVSSWEIAYYSIDLGKRRNIMGGSGSTRWNLHTKKTTVEECRKFGIREFRPYIRVGGCGRWVWWDAYTGKENASLGYQVLGKEKPTGIKLRYTITKWSGEKPDLDYVIKLTTTPLPWGGVRYWFICPLSVNGVACCRRVAILYLPPGGNYYGCRHCYNLTYKSSQEGNEFKSMYELLALQMQGEYPGLTWKDTRAMLNRETTENLKRITIEKYLRNWQPPPDPHEHYLSREQLLEQSGLSEAELDRLEAARLLVSDTKNGRYRPKLVGWGKKLAYLLANGWGVDEIKRWSNERWKMGNPGKWPPGRKE